ncbi:MAG: hypothetical protein KY468_20455, partial [Armatimonadetes bacterium]|nr:hypothetical protein [Armatimonadota bacterium]
MDFRSFYSSEWSDFPLGKSILLLLTLFVGVGGMLEGRYVAGVQQRAAAASKGSPKNPAPAGSKAAPKPSSSAPSVVYYRRDIKPLLDARCASCHGNGTRLGG